MAGNPESVVVELEARLNKFNADVKSGAVQFDQSMGTISSSATKAEAAVTQAHSRMSLGANQSRIAMLEMGHVVRGSVDQFAAGAPITQIFAQHIASVGEAASLAGGSLGSFGALMSGPWGLAITAGIALLATLVPKLFQTGDGLDAVYEKLLKHKEATALSQQAEDIWSHSLDGLIDRTKKLNEELNKRLQNQASLNQQTLAQAQHDQAAAQATVTRLENDPNATAKDIDKAQRELTAANRAFTSAQILAGQELGEAMGDITARAKLWADQQANIIAAIQKTHPELSERAPAAQLSASYTVLKKAISDAASAGLDFNATVAETNTLNDQLQHGAITVVTYTNHIKALATTLEAAAAAAKKLGQEDPVKQFKDKIIGAEGTGPNRQGSSAAGFGQFMPGTFEHYFRQAYPNQAGLSNPAIDNLRNNRTVAEGVIDVATKDYSAILQRAGQQITAASLYTMHLLSAGDPHGTVALRLLNAPANASARSVVGNNVAAVNGNIFTGTAGEARDRIANRIGGSSSAVSGGAAAVAAALAQQAQQAATREAAYQRELDALETKLLGAQKTKLLSTDQQLALAQEQVTHESEANDRAYAAAVKAGNIDATQAALLTEKNHQVATARAQRLLDDEALRKANLAAALEDQRQQANISELQDEVKNAKTGLERRDAMLRLLDAETELTRVKLQQTVDATAAGSVEHELAVLKLAQLNTEKARRAADIDRDPAAMTPGQAYVKSITRTAGQLNEDFQHVAIDGLQKMNDEITSAIMGTETLGQAFHNVANQIVSELVRIAIQQLIIKPMANLLFGSQGSPGGGGGIGGVISLFSSLFGHGGGLSPIPSALGLPAISFRASGGAVAAGAPYMVGENGPERFVPNQAGNVIPNGQLMRGSSFGHSVVEVHVVPNDDRFGAYVARITDPRIATASVRAARGGMQLTQQMLVQRQLHQLG